MLKAGLRALRMNSLPKFGQKCTPLIQEPIKTPGLWENLEKEITFEVSLSKINKISPDSYIYTYDLPDPKMSLGYKAGHHIFIQANVPTKEHPEGEVIQRYYTPVSRFEQKGNFDLLIKTYRANVHPEFPEGGPLTQYLEKMKLGDKLTMIGPIYRLLYHGHGKMHCLGVDHQITEFVMICGGTGVAPMYQVIQKILDDPTDPTKIHVLFANKSKQDILMKDKLEEAAKDPRIKIHYIVDIASPEWKGFTGYITKEILGKVLPKPNDSQFMWSSGLQPMERIVKQHLLDLGYSLERSFM